jgi:uncharacterized ion transporter superfamily protein YfcC
MENPITAVLSFIAKPFADAVGNWQARKNMVVQRETAKVESQLRIEEATSNAIIHRVQTADDNDFLLDIRAQENKKTSFIDELLIIYWLSIVTMHFIPATQPYMFDGWDAIEKAPMWFQIGIIIIMVTTMGGMRILRLFTDKANFKGVLGLK